MCFSALASFAAAGVTGAIGIVTLTRVSHGRELPLAATPLFFALQQSAEGLLWLHLPLAPDGSAATGLTLFYLLFADVFWPVYAPLAVMLIEPGRARRRLMGLGLALGAGVAASLLWWILVRPHGALIVAGHIVYPTDSGHSVVTAIAYIAAVGLPLLLSSQRTVVALGAIILVGCAIAYGFYWQAFLSVWCFFAAAASAVILFHFERSRRHRLRLAGA
jgi:uncharacterized protein DUF6629